MLPHFLTHYYHDEPFRSLTDLGEQEVDRFLQQLESTRDLPRRLTRDYRELYLRERRRFEHLMHEQFHAKGGRPVRERPHYLILGESDIWAKLEPQSLRIPLSHVPSEVLSFTATDSWNSYVDGTLTGRPIPRKPHYKMVYRLEELSGLIEEFGWPGERWKSEPEWEHDIYIEAQVWDGALLQEFLSNHGNGIS